ncbi:hypothetical protein QN239_32975 [Mycolicibacterium sp. Y3]
MEDMKGSDRAPLRERAIRVAAAVAVLELLVWLVLAMMKLIDLLGASAGQVDTWDVLLWVCVLGALVAATVIAWHIYDQGSDGARRVGSLITDTAGGKILSGVAATVLAAGGLMCAVAADGWGSRGWFIAVTVLWAAVSVRWLRNGWRQCASHREPSRHGPGIERIPE